MAESTPYPDEPRSGGAPMPTEHRSPSSSRAAGQLKPPNRYLNVTANYAGVVSALVVHVLLVPLYIRFLGAESFGVIGFFLTLQAILQVMDLGLGMALNRELARRTATVLDPQATADLVRTLEWVSWSVAVVIGIGVWVLADTLATSWLAPNTLSTDAVREAIGLMGLAIALQWPSSIYAGGIMGLQRQVLCVVVNVAGNLVFALGTLILFTLHPTVSAFLLWRAASSLLTVLVQRSVLWSSLPGYDRHITSRPDPRTLTAVWRFALGMSGIALTGVILMQLDKIIVSRVLPLDHFGAYMVASTAAALIPQLVTPIFATTLPPLSQASARSDDVSLQRYFHLTSQLITVVVHPVACAVALFAEPLLFLWTGEKALAANVAPVLLPLAFGGLLNSIMVPFYSVQLACGWTRIATVTNCLLIGIMVPYAAFAAQHWAAVGAASTWLVLNGVYILFSATVTLRKLLRGAARYWLFRDVGLPLVWTAGFITACRSLIPQYDSAVQTLLSVGLVTLLAMVGAAVLCPEVGRRAARVLFSGT